MNIQEVVDFICKTPENTNPNVLKSVLENMEGGGTPSVETVKFTYYNQNQMAGCMTGYYTGSDGQIHECENEGGPYNYDVLKNTWVVIQYTQGMCGEPSLTVQNIIVHAEGGGQATDIDAICCAVASEDFAIEI